MQSEHADIPRAVLEWTPHLVRGEMMVVFWMTLNGYVDGRWLGWQRFAEIATWANQGRDTTHCAIKRLIGRGILIESENQSERVRAVTLDMSWQPG